MSKNWLLALPVLLCLLSCDGFSTGGNPNEGKCSLVVKEHGEMFNGIRIICPFDSICDIKFSFGSVATPESYGCSVGFEYRLVQNGESKVVQKNYDYSTQSRNASVDLLLDSNDCASFSLFDINSVEKKYDIDLSGIINSYTVRGDSVDVKVMENCSLSLYECHRETVYGNRMMDSKYSFSILEGCKKYYSYDCSWHNQGTLNKDAFDIHAKIYWKE